MIVTTARLSQCHEINLPFHANPHIAPVSASLLYCGSYVLSNFFEVGRRSSGNDKYWFNYIFCIIGHRKGAERIWCSFSCLEIGVSSTDILRQLHHMLLQKMLHTHQNQLVQNRCMVANIQQRRVVDPLFDSKSVCYTEYLQTEISVDISKESQTPWWKASPHTYKLMYGFSGWIFTCLLTWALKSNFSLISNSTLSWNKNLVKQFKFWGLAHALATV